MSVRVKDVGLMIIVDADYQYGIVRVGVNGTAPMLPPIRVRVKFGALILTLTITPPRSPWL